MKCVSEILEHRLTIKKEYSVAKLGCGFIIVKSLDKYEQRCLLVSAIIVAMLLTRLPMKQGERPMVSAYYESNKVLGYPTAIFDCIVGSGSYIGVIILFFINGIITPNSL